MRVLIVGAFDGHMAQASEIALGRGAQVAHVSSLVQALKALRNGQGADLLLCDIVLDIGELVEALKSERFHLPVIACGVGTQARQAASAIRAGAHDYLSLPPDPELIGAILASVTSDARPFLWSDPGTDALVALAERIAPSLATVLITGESGTGKEVLARFVHQKSSRRDKPLISINCAAIPDTLIESELFGHEKGAFTSAVARRIGRFEEANHATLLLDEVSEMPVHLQAKLLRAIQEREIDRLGGNTPIPIDIRLIATSNRDLEREVQEGRFREDLYFRLNVIELVIPPLRDRPADIRTLAEHFARHYAQLNELAGRTLTQEAHERLAAHPWKGNVRELENTLHRSVLLARGEQIEASDILLTGHRRPDTGPGRALDAEMLARAGGMIGRTVEEVERELILGTLDHFSGDNNRAADILGISIRTLKAKLRNYQQSAAH